jgi:hypothetical protein
MSAPHPLHWKAVQRLMKYVKGTLTLGIKFTGNNQHRNCLLGYCDSDFAGCLDTRHSTSGIVILMNGGPIHWSSKKQSTVVGSSTEAEYVACYSATHDLVWLNQLLTELGFQNHQSITLYCDNLPAIKLIKNPVAHQRTRHIDIKYHYVREKYKHKIIDVQHIPTAEQIADIFTKPLTGSTFKRLRHNMQVTSV